MHPQDQTIFALSSGRPPSAISIVRVSGPQASAALLALAGKIPPPRMASRVLLNEPDQGPIDDAVVLWFPGPGSATGEDVAEFHVHGGRAILSALFTALAAMPDMRAAEPGEFTRRAFENGKLDLTEAEALDDLIQADTDRQRRQALRQLKGLLGDRVRNWRQQIIEAAALIEAGIDFVEEADVPAELRAPALAKVAQLASEIEEVLAAEGRSERMRDGLVVAITGPPNVGKSTLMNVLARREVAIVSPQAGTTRDVIEVQLDLQGFPVTVIDTAGIRESDDPIEQEGVRRARARAAEADLVLWLVADGFFGEPLGGEVPTWVVRNKVDLDGSSPYAVVLQIVETNAGLIDANPELIDDQRPRFGEVQFSISAQRGDGLQQLLDGLVTFAEHYFGGSDQALIGRVRHRELLRGAADMLRCSMEADGDELVAEGLRAASHALGMLLGRVDVEDVLDVVFREFCIGK
jgi:tRNA modification GTPase